MIKSYIPTLILFLCIVLVETAILSNLIFLPVIPDLLLLCLLYLSANNGKILGEVNGFVSGLLLDFLSGAPLGFNCIYRTLIGYLTGIGGLFFSTEGFFMPSIYAFFGTVLKVFFINVLLILFPHIKGEYSFLSLHFLFELLANMILCPYVFKLLNLFNSTLINQHRIYSNEK